MSGESARVAGDVSGAGTRPDHPTLLPALLIADPDVDVGQVRRTTRDWVVDTLCFLVAALIGAIFYLNLHTWQQVPPPSLFAVDASVAALGCLALWWRRRWPVAIAIPLISSTAVLSLPVGASLVALFTVAVHRRATVAAPIVVLSVLVAVPYYLLYPNPTMPYWGQLIVALGFMAAITAWGMFVRARRQLVLSLRDRAHRAEAEQHLRAEQARQAERARIAREMHDVLAHRISLLSTYAGALEFRSDASPDEVADAAGIIRASSHQALQDLREVIGVLREDARAGDPDRPQPTAVDLPELAEESRRAGLRVDWENRVDDLRDVPDGVGRGAYRIVQEGLTNVRKHADGTVVAVTVAGAPGAGLTVEVRNPLPVGRETQPDVPGAGSGLVGLAERASLAGGHLEHGHTGDGAFRLRAWLPWPT